MPVRTAAQRRLIAMALLAALPAHYAAGNVDRDAGDSQDTPAERVQESVQVTARRTEKSVQEVPEAVTVIGLDEIERKAPQVIAEMLRGAPGAYFQQTTPGQGTPIIRGLKGSEVLHLVDGMRLNNAIFRNAPNQYLALVDAYNTRRIEVVRGSAPSMHGADAMGGVVQVLTLQPDFAASGRHLSGRFYASFRSADQGIVGRAEAVSAGERQVLSGGITYQNFGDRRTGGGTTISPSAYDVGAADLKWRGRVGENGELLLSAQWLEQPDTPRVDELVPGFGQDHPAAEEFAFKPNRRQFIHAAYTLDSADRLFQNFSIDVARQIIDDDRSIRQTGDSVLSEETNRSTLDGLTAQFTSSWSSHNELTWGAEFYRDRVDSDRQLTSAGSTTPIGVPGRFPDGSSMKSIALYAANTWTGNRIDVTLGMRYSRFDIQLPPAVKIEPDDLTGDVHLAWKASETLRVVANAGRGFRPPNIFDLGTLGARPGSRFNVPNADLQPEIVYSYDLGLKYQAVNLQAELFGFYSDYRDKIASVATGEVTADGRTEVRSENLNSVTLYGFESGVRWSPAERWQTYLTLNYTWGEESSAADDTGPADRIPPLNGRLGLVWRNEALLRFETWVDFAAMQDRLSERDVLDPRIDPDGSPSWLTVNALLAWQNPAGVEFGLRLGNLADRRYREHGSGIDAPGRSVGLWVNLPF